MTDPTGTTGTRWLTFVPDAAAAPGSPAGGLTVVLDAAWTPGPGDRPDVVSIRPFLAAAVERHDLFREALEVLDRWAEAAGVADQIVVEGATYWFRVRETLWHWVHERLLWRYAMSAIDARAPSDAVAAPAEEEALADVVHALGRPLEVRPGSNPGPGQVGGAASTSVAVHVRSVIRRAIRRLRPTRDTPAAAERRRRDAFLAERFDRLSELAAPRAVVLTLPSSYQRIGATGTGHRQDPNLGSVIPKLRAAGLEPIVIGWGMSRTADEDWPAVELDDRMLPAYFVKTRWGRPEDEVRAAAVTAEVLGNLDAVSGTRFDLDGLDVTAAFMDVLRASLGRIIKSDVPELARVQRFVAEIGPAAMLMTQEGHRTPWLIAGARAAVPTFAVQHGVLYPTHPGYADRRHPRLVLPSCTFVYGDYERRVLEAGAYGPGEVLVSGSPRLDLNAAARAPAERDAVRRELGVADGDRMLVVTTVHTPFVRRSHLVHMLEACLGGPLPGVHLVFKQHPGERDPGPYRGLLGGLARAGGYEPPPTTIVKDIDLYRLLRAADAHLGLHSTVLTDAVKAGTCNLIALVEGSADLLGYVAAGVARPIHDAADLRWALDDPQLLEPDARRAFLDDHFQPGVASDRIAAVIQEAVRDRHDPAAAGAR